MAVCQMQEITSKDNQNIKFAVSLHDKKARKKEKLCLLESKTVIQEALKRGNEITQIFFRDESLFEEMKDLIQEATESFKIDQDLMAKIATTDSAPPIFAIMKSPEIKDPILDDSYDKITGGNLFLYCENVQDPGNLGSIIRTAFAAGVKSIYLSPSCVDVLNTKTIRSSMGTVFYGSIQYLELDELISKLKAKSTNGQASLEIIGTSPRAESFHSEIQFNPMKNILVLVGNESQGLKDNSLDLCTNLIKIPMENDVESINVLAATSVVLFDLKTKLDSSLKRAVNN